MSDPDRTSPKELSKDEIWGYVDRVLQLGQEETLDGMPGPFQAERRSDLLRFFPVTLFFFILISRLILSHLFHRGSNASSPDRISQKGWKVWLGKPPRGRPHSLGRTKGPRRSGGSSTRAR